MEGLRCVLDFCDQAKAEDIKQWSEKRLDSVISARERCEDNFHVTIEQLKENNISLASHRNCVSTYTSSTHIEIFKKTKTTGASGARTNEFQKIA